jgi:putative membrane protein
MKRRVSLGLVVIAIGCVRMADAAGNQLVKQDKNFVLAVAADGLTEVKLGEIAKQRATSPSIKEFAATMVRDHTAADDDLKNIAASHNLQLPTELDKDHQAQVDKIIKLNDGQFDQAYLDQMIAAHKKAVAALEGEEGTNAGDLKDWTERTLPTIKHHLSMILNIKSKVPHAL